MGPAPDDPGEHAAWHAEQGLADPDGLLATFWARLVTLSPGEVGQILLATRSRPTLALAEARHAARRLIEIPAGDIFSLELELDEFRLREAIAALGAGEEALDEERQGLLYGALRDALLAFAAAQTEATLAKRNYDLLSAPWWAAVGRSAAS